MRFQQYPWRHDPRSRKFSHQKFFGATPLVQLPPTLDRPRGPVLDQKNSQRCTAYGSVANGWYIHGVEFSPDWQAYKIGQLQGRSVDTYGGDPNATMKSQDFGFLPKWLARFSLEEDGIEGSGFNAPWPQELDFEAAYYDRIPGFVRVDGPYDIFDNIRSALYREYDPVTKNGACVDAFGRWYHDWSNTPGGIIPKIYSRFAGYHRYLFIDWVTIDGIEYLVAQNSYGTAAGKQGFHYFPREVVNAEFKDKLFGGTTLKICKTLTKEQMTLAKQETPVGRIWRAIIDIWYQLSLWYGVYLRTS